jgi:hypothetical protein
MRPIPQQRESGKSFGVLDSMHSPSTPDTHVYYTSAFPAGESERRIYPQGHLVPGAARGTSRTLPGKTRDSTLLDKPLIITLYSAILLSRFVSQSFARTYTLCTFDTLSPHARTGPFLHTLIFPHALRLTIRVRTPGCNRIDMRFMTEDTEDERSLRSQIKPIS